MKVLLLGGSPNTLGGIEAFCDRSQEALEALTPHRVERLNTDTAYMIVRRLPEFLKSLAALVGRSEKPDCLWVQYGNLFDLAFVVVGKVAGYRVMATPHLGRNWRSQSSPILRGLSDWAFGRADRIASISETQLEELNFPPRVPVSFIRNFLSRDYLEPNAAPARSGELRLIHSGRLSKGKGTFLFVDVCRALKAAGLPFTATITGEGDAATMDQLRRMIAEGGLNEHIAILGRVSDEDLIGALRQADVLVHLSRIDSYPLIVLEAMACGAFPVCLDLAGAKDMVDTYDGAVVGEANPAGDAAAAILALPLQTVRSRAESASARVRSDYDWRNAVAALEAALSATAAAPRSGG